MISDVFVALGLVVVIEGLALVLAPKRWEDMLRALGEMPYDTRRFIGLLMVALGVAAVWTAKSAF